jgi:hypothetical protein
VGQSLSLPFPSRVNPKHRGDDYEQQHLHEHEETRHELSIIIVSVKIDDEGACGKTSHEPNELTLNIPHSSRLFQSAESRNLRTIVPSANPTTNA